MSSNKFILLVVNCNKNEIEVGITKVFLSKIEVTSLLNAFWDFSEDIEGSLTAYKSKETQYWTFETTSSNLEYLAFDIEQLINKLLPSQSVRINWD